MSLAPLGLATDYEWRREQDLGRLQDEAIRQREQELTSLHGEAMVENEKRAITYDNFASLGLLSPPVAAGVPVTQQNANTISAYWNGVTVISGDIGSLDRHLYRRVGEEDDRLRADSHPAYKVIHEQPNVTTTAVHFWETITSHAVSWGNGYAEIEWDNAMRPIGLWLITPDLIEPKVEVFADRRGRLTSRIYYLYRGSTRIEAEDIFHVAGLGFDGVRGYSPVYLARQSLGLTIAAERFGSSFFGGGAWPGLAIEHPKNLSLPAHERLKSSISDNHVGPDRAHRMIVLEEGMKISKPITIPPNDAQFLECVVPETDIALADGTRKRAVDVAVGDCVWGWSESDGLIPSRIEAVAANGVHPVLTIRTHRGREITVTKNHPFLASRRARCERCGRNHRADVSMASGWIKAEDLSVGDYLSTLDGVSWVGTNEMAAEDAYFVGAMLGDGSIRKKNAMAFSNKDAGVLAAVGSAAATYGADLRHRSGVDYELCGGAKIGRPSRTETLAQTNPLRSFFAELGLLGTDSYSKFIPDAVFRSGFEQVRGVLAGLFDTDGSVRKVKAGEQPMAYVCTTSRRLASDAQHALAMIGIQAAIRTQQPTRERTAVRYEVTVCGRENVRRLSALPLRHDGKAKRLAHWAASATPKERDVFRRMDRIVAITAEPPRATVAITVEGTHSHVTAGLISHNTRSFQIEEVARWLNLPVHKLKHKSGERPGGNFEANELDYCVTTLMPWTTRIEQECDRKLISPSQRSTYYTEHNFQKRLKTDTDTRMRAWKALYEMEVVDSDLIARRENLPKPKPRPVPASAPAAPVNEPIVLPSSTTRGDPGGHGPIADERVASAARGVAMDAVGRFSRREAQAVRRASKKGAEGFQSWAETFYRDEGPVLRGFLRPAVVLSLACRGLMGDPDRVAEALSARYLDRSKEDLLGLPAKDLAGRADDMVTRWETGRVQDLAEEILIIRPEDAQTSVGGEKCRFRTG
jgi:HK97 family phage portal protein